MLDQDITKLTSEATGMISDSTVEYLREMIYYAAWSTADEKARRRRYTKDDITHYNEYKQKIIDT